MQSVTDLYSKAQRNWSDSLKATCYSETDRQDEIEERTSSVIQRQIDAYTNFLQSFAKLARNAWTEFDLWFMGIGLLLMVLSVVTQACALVKMNTVYQSSDQKCSSSRILAQFSLAFILVMIRAASFLSNSYICEFCQMK